MSALATLPAFSHPVDDAQAVFRAVLAALSRPGLPVALAAGHLPPPAPGLSQGLLAPALALCDTDTPIWLDAAADTTEARHHLRFHCAAPLAESPAQAAFALISRPQAMPRLSAFHPGRPDFPDRSATLVIQANLDDGRAPGLELTGPGVEGNDRGAWRSFCVSGLPEWFWEDWQANHEAYPLGVDVIFVESAAAQAGAPVLRLLGLPRTARVRLTSDPSGSKEQTSCM